MRDLVRNFERNLRGPYGNAGAGISITLIKWYHVMYMLFFIYDRGFKLASLIVIESKSKVLNWIRYKFVYEEDKSKNKSPKSISRRCFYNDLLKFYGSNDAKYVVYVSFSARANGNILRTGLKTTRRTGNKQAPGASISISLKRCMMPFVTAKTSFLTR